MNIDVSFIHRQVIRVDRIAALLIAIVFAGCAAPQPKREADRGPGRVVEIDNRERPGLATRAGAIRESWVEPAYFARAWGDRPSASDRVLYNDRDGVIAMVAYLGGEPQSANGMGIAAGGLVRMGFRDGDGRWLDGMRLRGQRFAIGIPGARYEIVLKNETRRRLEVVVTVDGLDTLDGRAGSFKKRGYVLAPRETTVVDGYRTSDGTVASFQFSNVITSYAARSGADTKNVGAIGLAVFSERLFGSSTVSPENRASRRRGVPVIESSDYPSSRRYAQPPPDA